MAALKALQQSLGHAFKDLSLLRRALTHRSYGATHNERLEFLGDSVVNCAIAAALYYKFPELPEGELSRLRASLVSEPALARLASQLKLGDILLLGEGELKSGGARRPSILSDAVEALFGAVMIDGGFNAARDAVERVFSAALTEVDPNTTGKDAKTMLQEFLQRKRLPLPQYTVAAIRGEAHEQEFEVQCVIEQLHVRCTGKGSSRRRAEQDAARQAYALATAS
ncbi:MAG: ribonuclease III [Betaproteobacteria bacterium]|nr:ribonuclease III [Betaproteobacteria bacterium]